MSYVGNSCPNCGAPITAPVCDYCGTRHWGLEQVPTSKVVDMLDKGLISINQAREMVGLRPLLIEDEWDSYYSPEQCRSLHEFVVATATKNVTKRLFIERRTE